MQAMSEAWRVLLAAQMARKRHINSEPDIEFQDVNCSVVEYLCEEECICNHDVFDPIDYHRSCVEELSTKVKRHPIDQDVLKQHNATASILRLLPLGAFALGLGVVQFLIGRRIDTAELLRTVDATVQKVRYLGDPQPLQTKSPGSGNDSVAFTKPRSSQSIKVPRKQRTFYARPVFQLMATNNDEIDEEILDTDDGFSVVDGIKSVIPLLLLVLVASKLESILHLSQVLKQNASPAYIRDSMVPILDRLNGAGIKGQAIYTLSLLLWTMTVGITTPLETAAGIAFGAKKGIICNAIGKIGGAVLSFVLGRQILYKYVHKKLKNNEILNLVEESIEEHPLGVSLMMRFSPLPEFAKNFGLSILKVRARWFAVAVLLHGLPFTCLWTSVGAETASIMRGGAPSSALKFLLTGVTWFSKSFVMEQWGVLG
ncbi:MAG: hypothetical protein SGBAC_012599 [Bacillariaceae sp.]